MLRTSSRSRLHESEARLRLLMLETQAGDSDAYRAFLRELATHLRRFLAKRLRRHPQEVEDLVQECLIAVHEKRHTYDTAQPLTPWIHAIARYKLVDHLRCSRRDDIASDDVDAAPDARATASHDVADARRDVAKLLARLPDRQRLPIVHVKIEGLSVAEAATATGMSISAVKVGIHRGLRALAAMVGRRE